MAVITISRLLGADGDDIAMKVAEGLGYNLVDSALITGIAESAGVSIEEVENYDEKYHSRAGELLKSIFTPRISKIILDKGGKLDPESYLKCCGSVILGLAEKGNMVIVGRGAQFILENDETAFHIRIIADEVFRAEFLKSSRGISIEKARELIKKSDRTRKNFIERSYNANLDDPSFYHLVIDSARLGIDITASIIIEAVRQFSRSREYIPGEKDSRGKDRRIVQQRKGERRYSISVWTTRDMENAILHEGRPVRALNKPDRRLSDRRKKSRRDK